MHDLTDVKMWLAQLIQPIVYEAVKAANVHPSTALPQPVAPEVVSPDEICKRLDISKPTLWAWEKKGIIIGHHLGNRKYYIWDEVIAKLTKKGGVSA